RAICWAAAATAACSLGGGCLAVCWTGGAQGARMLFALIVTPVLGLVHSGGPVDALEVVRELDPTKLSWIGVGGIVAIISALAWGLGYCGQPHILARFMAAESIQSIPKARRIGMGWMILCMVGSLTGGFVALP